MARLLGISDEFLSQPCVKIRETCAFMPAWTLPTRLRVSIGMRVRFRPHVSVFLPALALVYRRICECLCLSAYVRGLSVLICLHVWMYL